MRKLLGIFITLIIAFTSCEGRTTQSQALLEDIKVFKESVDISIDIFEPETYLERETDTILSNGYHIKIKTYADMDHSVLFTKIKDTVNYQTYYRNFKFDILVEKDGKTIYNNQFDKQKINKLFRFDSATKSNIDDYDFDKLGVLKSVQLKDSMESSKGITIEVLYAIPETDRYSLHTLLIDKNGTLDITREIEN